MAISPILAGKFTGVETSGISFNPTNKDFLMGYYGIKEHANRIKHLEDLNKRIGFDLKNSKGGISKMINDLIEDPFKYVKENEVI